MILACKEELDETLKRLEDTMKEWKLALKGEFRAHKLAIISFSALGVIGLIIGAIGLYRSLGSISKSEEDDEDDESLEESDESEDEDESELEEEDSDEDSSKFDNSSLLCICALYHTCNTSTFNLKVHKSLVSITS